MKRAAAVVVQSVNSLIDHSGLEFAGHLSFTAMLALFPFLIFLSALAGFFGNEQTARDFISFLFQFTPKDVAQTLTPAVHEVLAARRGGLLTVSILGTLWAASSGFEALRLVLNSAYRVEEPRPIWWRRLQSLVLVVISALGIFLASVAVIFGPIVWDLIHFLLGVSQSDRWAWLVFRYVIGTLMLTAVLLALHQWLPNIKQPWTRIMPGVLTTLVLWMLVSTGLSLYFGTLGDYSVTYGALGGVVITLLFFYLAGLSFIFGAELNAHL